MSHFELWRKLVISNMDPGTFREQDHIESAELYQGVFNKIYQQYWLINIIGEGIYNINREDIWRGTQ